MDGYSLESFISYCDEMMIAEEDFKSIRNKVADWVDAFIRKFKSIIERMILVFRKLKKYRIPDEVRKNIVRVRYSCDTLWFRLISDGEESYDNSNSVDTVKKSKEYMELFLSNKTYPEETYLDVPVNSVVTDLQKLNKTLTNTEISYNKAKRRDEVINHSYWNTIISVLQISMSALNKYFTFGKAQTSNENEVVEMPDFEVEIIDH